VVDEGEPPRVLEGAKKHSFSELEETGNRSHRKLLFRRDRPESLKKNQNLNQTTNGGEERLLIVLRSYGRSSIGQVKKPDSGFEKQKMGLAMADML